MANILSYLWFSQFTFQHSKLRAFNFVSPRTGTKSDFLRKYKQTKARPFSFQAVELVLPKELCLIPFSSQHTTGDFLTHLQYQALNFSAPTIKETASDRSN